MNIALVLSGGVGTRLKSKLPKQYILVNNRPIISYCLQTFADSEDIDVIWIVADPMWRQMIMRIFDEHHMDHSKLKGFSEPGQTRQTSIMNGLQDIKEALDLENASIMIHDAVRPMITKENIAAYFSEMDGHDGVMPVLSMKDTVYLSEDGKRVSGLLDRSRVYAGQSPEIFDFSKYLDACERLTPDAIFEINGSSEPALLAGMDIHLVPGDEKNFKITTQEDLDRFAEVCMQDKI